MNKLIEFVKDISMKARDVDWNTYDKLRQIEKILKQYIYFKDEIHKATEINVTESITKKVSLKFDDIREYDMFVRHILHNWEEM